MLRVPMTAVALLLLWIGVATGTYGTLVWQSAPDDEDLLALSCGRRVVSEAGPERPVIQTLDVVLLLDEEWRAHFGEASEREARLILAGGMSHFGNLGIRATPIRIDEWKSPDAVDSIDRLLTDVAEATDLGPADLGIVLTGQRLAGPDDGHAPVGGRFAIVAHHQRHAGRDEFVLAHEIGHIFGAHHGCDVKNLGGLMAEAGFRDPLVCPCTRRVLEMNLDRFHAG